MKYIFFLMVLFSISIAERINLDRWDKEGLSQFLLNNTTNIDSVKIKNITDKFLNIPYKANVLIGSTTQKEELVIDLANLDCFTFIDYVEAMKRSDDFDEFKTNLIFLRYQSGNINYASRNHFFSNWTLYNGFENITSSISPNSRQVIKTLNLSQKNRLHLDGIRTKKIKIDYIDSKDFNQKMLEKFQTGDYIGIYTHKAGLDVIHTGIIIKKEGKTYFRHASNKKKFYKVVDELFAVYIKNTPGFIILRKKN